MPAAPLKQPTILALLSVLALVARCAHSQETVTPKCLAYATVNGLPLNIEEYTGTPYLFLENGDLKFTIPVAPNAQQTLELLWGSKQDNRTATVTINGISQNVSAGGYDGFRWQKIDVPPEVKGDRYDVTLGRGAGKVAFIAAVRLLSCPLTDDQSCEVPSQNQNVVFQLPLMQDGWPVVESFEDRPVLQRNGLQAQRALRQSLRFVQGWLTKVDPTSGLIPENLTSGMDRWNGQNNAADNYPFMVLTAALTDRALMEGPLLEMLHSEQRLTNRVDRLGDVYKFSTRTFEYPEVDLHRVIFNNSEYVKDGLMPLTEWLGPSPWSERMSGIIDDIWKHAPVETPAGLIPSTNGEVNGEMMQLTSRYFWMTGDRQYLERAQRIADWYLLGDHHPTRNSDLLKLRDHGCELISGLTEVYFTCSHVDQEKAELYREPLHEILDCILRYGVDSGGMMVNAINPQSGAVVSGALSDCWGYNYNGFYTVYLVDGTQSYREAVRHALSHLNDYRGYPWEGKSHDGYADSIESAINLYNREPVDVAAEWIDSQMRIMLAMQRDDGIIGGWHGDGNFARTAIMYALWKQQGITVQPWRADLQLGAVQSDGTVTLQLTAEQPWQGRLIFDQPRHKTIMHMPQDYPRINQFPEWFTVDGDKPYEITEPTGQTRAVSGQQLIDGLAVAITPDSSPLQWTVGPDTP